MRVVAINHKYEIEPETDREQKMIESLARRVVRTDCSQASRSPPLNPDQHKVCEG
jgi:hypothetical protein